VAQPCNAAGPAVRNAMSVQWTLVGCWRVYQGYLHRIMNLMRASLLWILGGLLSASAQGAAPDEAVAGKAFFRQQCSVCHTAEPGDNGGAQGPSLQGVFGKAAASNSAFSYTSALRESKLIWNAPTLDRFLASPTTVVPGTTMVIAVTGKEDRDSVIAYLQSVANIKPESAPAATTGGDADWKKDAPGRVHHVAADSLPRPFATQSSRNNTRLVDKPADSALAVPAGFKVAVFARDLANPRAIRTAPNGDIFVSESAAGRIKVLRPSADGTTAEVTQVFAEHLTNPFGLAFYPNGNDPQWLYVGEVNRIVRYAYRKGDMKARGEPEVVIPELASTVGGHITRDLVFSKDGKHLFFAVGSQSNFAEQMPKKSVAEAKAWEAEHGLGAAWDKEANRAAVFDHDLNSGKTHVFATGIRNCVGLTLQPATEDLWCATNERDALGDDLVPDYVTRVQRGGFYGWPWYYLGNHEDPRLQGDRPDLAGKAILPDVLLTAHSAALSVTFYTATSGASAFPPEYRGDAFVGLHGSWNRGSRTGHKLVRIRMKNNVPTGAYEDFLTGFIVSDNNAWGRPVATTVASDGSLLMTEDAGNTIYRISYSGK
jgi:glucose/arabinose dehydrogenase